MIRFVYFDAGGTLLHAHPSVGAVYAAAGAPFGLERTPEQLQRAFAHAWKRRTDPQGREAARMGKDFESARAWWRALVEEVLEAVAFHGDRAQVFEAAFAAFAKVEAWRIFDDVGPALDALQAHGVRAGVLSNWDYRLRPLLGALGLEPRFETLLISCELGLAKPDPRLYRLALERTGLEAREVLHIGDQQRLDLRPAQLVGMQARLIDRHAPASGPEVLRSLTEVLALLAA